MSCLNCFTFLHETPSRRTWTLSRRRRVSFSRWSPPPEAPPPPGWGRSGSGARAPTWLPPPWSWAPLRPWAPAGSCWSPSYSDHVDRSGTSSFWPGVTCCLFLSLLLKILVTFWLNQYHLYLQQWLTQMCDRPASTPHYSSVPSQTKPGCCVYLKTTMTNILKPYWEMLVFWTW